MMKGLMGCCLNHELNELKTWKTVQEKKLALSEEARDELEKQTELLKQILEDKEKEISDTKNHLRQAKEEAIHEYHDSDALLAELKRSFAEGFDDALRQVKTSYPDLDVSHVTIDSQAQTLVQPVHSESTEKLFADVPSQTTLMVTEGLLLRAKPKPSRTTPVNLKIKFWRKKMMTLPFSNNFPFSFLFLNVKVSKNSLCFNLSFAFCMQTFPFMGFK